MSRARVVHDKRVFSGADLVEIFRELGLASGDSVVVHSSMKVLGPVEGGADTVLDALIETVGPNGNLMVPTFSSMVSPPKRYFDPATTPSNTGILTEVARRRQAAVRSLHPTHSVTVIGSDAEALTRNHLAHRSVGIGSPLDRLAQTGGKVLLIGVTHTRSTMVHVGEEHSGIPKAAFTDPLGSANVLLPDGNIVEHPKDTSTSCSAGFNAIEYPLRRRSCIRDTTVGRFERPSCAMLLMSAMDIINTVCEIVEDKPDVLLCTGPHCRPCKEARRLMRERNMI